MSKRLPGVPLAEDRGQGTISPAVAQGRAVQASAEAGRPGALQYHEPPDTQDIDVESEEALDHSSSDTSDAEMPAAAPAARFRPDEGFTQVQTPVRHPESQPAEDWDEDLAAGSSRGPLPGLGRGATAATPASRELRLRSSRSKQATESHWPRARHGCRPGLQRIQLDAPAP